MTERKVPRCCATIEAVKLATKDMNSFESAMYAWNAYANLALALELEHAEMREALEEICSLDSAHDSGASRISDIAIAALAKAEQSNASS